MASCVVFVCIGNTVRSPFAEFLFAKMLSEKSDELGKRLKVLSAGFIVQKLKEQLAKAQVSFPEPFYGRPMSKAVRVALLEGGIDVPIEWRSKELNPKMVRDADLIMTMLPEIKEEMRDLFHEAQNKIFTLREMSGWDEYLIFEDFYAPTLNNNYWHFVEEDPEFVSQTLLAVGDNLVRAFPNIIRKLGIRTTPDGEIVR